MSKPKLIPYPCFCVADGTLNTLAGCSGVNCGNRDVCWARRFAKRCGGRNITISSDAPQTRHERVRGYRLIEQDGNGTPVGRTVLCCEDCYDFVPHKHPERWENFHPKPGQRIAWNWMGDMFDPGHSDNRIERDLIAAHARGGKKEIVYLIQTRHVPRAIDMLYKPIPYDWPDYVPWTNKQIEIGTTFASLADLPNVEALASLPKGVVRFIAFEPIFPKPLTVLTPGAQADFARAIDAAKPNWAYIGVRTPGTADAQQQQLIAMLAKGLQERGCKVLFKPSCGPDLYKRNEGVTL